MKIETFNTGRRYTAEGQRIAWATVDGVTYFVDYDRSIYAGLNHEATTNAEVLAAYDAGDYGEMVPVDIERELIRAATGDPDAKPKGFA